MTYLRFVFLFPMVAVGNSSITQRIYKVKKSLETKCKYFIQIEEESISEKNQKEYAMKYLKEATIIFAVTAVGECLYALLPFPIPSSIYGLCLMLLLLFTGILKVEQVEHSGRFLIEIMPVMFIPPAVGLLATWADLAPVLLPVLLIILVTTVLVMIVTGKVTEFFMNKGEKK